MADTSSSVGVTGRWTRERIKDVQFRDYLLTRTLHERAMILVQVATNWKKRVANRKG